MSGSVRLFVSIWASSCCLKLLLIPAYKSTDFEVHRNWLAVTSSLPLNKWYVDETSQWTLDYPPMFAWMERLLASAAQFVDPQMLTVSSTEYNSRSTLVFQRVSVIVTDLVLVFAVWCWVNLCAVAGKQAMMQETCVNPQLITTILFLVNAGLIFVDNIHFQYNGFLFGILLLSILRINQRRFLEGAFWFAVLLNFKHIYLYISPAYGIYMFKTYCFDIKVDKNTKKYITSFKIVKFVSLAVVVISIFLLSFGPFIATGQLFQVLSRLFPFKRGLCHAYWAPNIWALYNAADKILSVAGKLLGLINLNQGSASMTGGLVQEYEHAVLPSIRPIHTLILTIVSILPAVWHVWKHPRSSRAFIQCVILCAFGSFMFGWHVHEKAILLVIVPLICLATTNDLDANLFTFLSIVGYYSMLPLIFKPAEAVIKYSLLILHSVFSYYMIGALFTDSEKNIKYSFKLLNTLETVYLVGIIIVELYCQVVHQILGFDDKLPFLPLMLTSVYSSVGVTYSWLKTYYYYVISA